MAKLTTSKALKRILTSEAYLLRWLQAGYSKAYRRQCRHRLSKNELSLVVQEKILTRLGFQVVTEKQWEITRYL